MFSLIIPENELNTDMLVIVDIEYIEGTGDIE